MSGKLEYVTLQRIEFIFRVSATNCAKLYDIALSSRDESRLKFGAKLTGPHVWMAFVMKSLLDDRARNGGLLQVPHTGEQKIRFDAAMQEMNDRYVLYGQPEVPHYCDKCMRVYVDEDGNLCT